MKRLWSPWRLQYILSEKSDGCIFCQAFSADSSEDKEYLILHRGTHSGVIMNLYPYNNGHLMIVPYAHQPTLEDVPPEAQIEIMNLINKCTSALRQAMNAQGFNIGINMGEVAGAGIGEHVHVHVLPRWAGDTNFITTLNETRCIPDSLIGTYEKIKAVWNPDTND